DDDRGQSHRLAQGIAYATLRQRIDRRRAALERCCEEREDRGLGDDDNAEDESNQVTVEDQERAHAEEGRRGECEDEGHPSPSRSGLSGGSRPVRCRISTVRPPETRRNRPTSNPTAVVIS